MAIITNTAGYGNIGRDLSIALTSPDTGDVILLTQVVSVSYRAVTLDITRTLINSRTILADLPRYWEGTVEYVRGDGNIDDAIWTIENGWLNQITGSDFQLGTMIVRISSAIEGTTELTFLDVSLKQEDSTWKADDVTIGKLAFRAGQRRVATTLGHPAPFITNPVFSEGLNF